MKKLLLAVTLILLIHKELFAAETQEFVTTTAVQELLNKTLTSPVIKGTPTADPALAWRMGSAAHTAPATVGPTPPATCSDGDMHFRTGVPATQALLGCIDATWVVIGGGGAGGGDVSSNTAISVDNELALFSGTSGKLVKRATGTGLLRMSSGVLSSYSLTAGSSKISILNPTGATGPPTIDVVEANVLLSNLGGALPAAKLPAFTGDVTAPGGSAVTTLANIPTAVPMAGYVQATNISPPSAPPAGKTDIYIDAGTKLLSAKNDANAVSITVFPTLCGGGNVVVGVNTDGSLQCAAGGGVNEAGDYTWTGAHVFNQTIGTVTFSGAPGGSDCDRAGIHGIDTTGAQPYYCTTPSGAPRRFADLAFSSLSDGTNTANASAPASLRLGVARGIAAQVFERTASFTNQPANDAIEIVSSNSGDTTQTITLWGTVFNGGGELVSETVLLTGTSPAATLRANWNTLESAELSGTTTGNITIREASGNATITTITAGATRAATTNQAIVRLAPTVSASAPTLNSDQSAGFRVGSTWIDTTASRHCVAISVTIGSAVWDCGSAGAQSLSQVLAIGNRVTAITPGAGIQIASDNGTDYASLWWNNSKGFAISCFPDDCLIYRAVWIDMAATEPLGNCVVASEQIPAGSYKRRYGACADTTGDEFHFGWTFDKGWNGGTVRVVPVALNTNATPSGTFTVAINGHCTPAGTAPPALSTTNSQDASFTTWTAQNSEEQVETSPITVNGTCTNAPTEPTTVDFRARVTAAPAQIADIRLKGFLLLYADTSVSH